MHKSTFWWEIFQNFIYALILETFYCRFINNTFFLCDRAESELIEFISNLKKKHLTITFKFTYLKININILYTKIFNNQNGVLCTTIYKKLKLSMLLSCHHDFLHNDSAHPKSLKESYVRIKGIWNIRYLKNFKDAFLNGAISLNFWTIISKEQCM